MYSGLGGGTGNEVGTQMVKLDGSIGSEVGDR